MTGPSPSHVPTHAQTAASGGVLSRLRGWALVRTDSPVEQPDSNCQSPLRRGAFPNSLSSTSPGRKPCRRHVVRAVPRPRQI
jgi:hypothetical protein